MAVPHAPTARERDSFLETDMHDNGFRRWVMLGALAAASWQVAACGVLPEYPGNETYRPGLVRSPAQSGYNGTIQDIPTSIDPRTPQTAGAQGRSLRMDPGQRALLEQQGQGGSGLGGTASQQPGAGGSLYTPTRQEPATQTLPGKIDRPSAAPHPLRPEKHEK
jgi:hypothetical protein